MQCNLRELDKTNGLHARLKNTKFAYLSSFWSEDHVDRVDWNNYIFWGIVLNSPRFVVASAFNNSSSIPLLNKLNKIITFSFVRIDNRQAFQVRSV